MAKTAEIILDGKSYKLPVIEGTENEVAIDISDLREMTGAITLDLGYKNTGSTKSAVTFLDGDNGILRYRGYTIEELAEKSTFIEVAYLLIFGELPTGPQLDRWTHDITHHTFVHEDLKQFFEGFRYDAHPMGMLLSGVGALSTFYPDAKQINDREAAKMCRDLANAIEEQLTYPGEIKVQVLREFRTVEFAK